MVKNENTNTFEYIEENKNITEPVQNNNEIKITEEMKEAFVTGLPEWDLIPPYDLIRRVNRK